MIDFNLKRTINVLAYTSLAMGVIGCGKKEEEEESTCDVFRECDPDSFEESYDSLRECEADEEASRQELVDEAGRSCGRAYDKFAECWVKAYGRACDADSGLERCEDEAEDFVNECPTGDDYDYDYDYDY